MVPFSACSASRGKVIEIDVSEIQTRGHMPYELTRMLGVLGYDWVPVDDPLSRRGVKVSRSGGQYRMKFRHLQHPRVRIDVRMEQVSGFSRLDFYEKDRQDLSPSSVRLLQELRARTKLQFGAGNVRIGG